MMRKIGQPQVFDLLEAKELLPLVKRITHEADLRATAHEDRLNHLLLADPRRESVQQLYKKVITQWKHKMEGLGLHVDGLWRVKFDVGEGYLCWQFPEVNIGTFLAPEQNWDERQRLTIIIDETDPDWARN